jgi:hypothetical protein
MNTYFCRLKNKQYSEISSLKVEYKFVRFIGRFSKTSDNILEASDWSYNTKYNSGILFKCNLDDIIFLKLKGIDCVEVPEALYCKQEMFITKDLNLKIASV